MLIDKPVVVPSSSRVVTQAGRLKALTPIVTWSAQQLTELRTKLGFDGIALPPVTNGIGFYRVSYDSAGVGNAATFTARAVGDLDCDGGLSTFIRRGAINVASGDVTGNAAPEITSELE